MKQLTFVNQKGGVGKTTVALLIGAVLRKAHASVRLRDLDVQGTASFFADKFELSSEPDGEPDYIIADTAGHMDLGGRAGRDLRDLIQSSDRIILVTEKSLAAIHASMPMAALITQNLRPGAKAYVLFNKVRHTTIGNQPAKQLAEELGLPALRTEIPLASAFENAFAGGLASVPIRHQTILRDAALEMIK